MLLAIDIGNTNTNFGLFEGDRLHQEWRLSSDVRRTPDDFRATLHALALTDGLELTQTVDGITIGSVVPALTETVGRVCEQWLKQQPLLMHVGLDLGMEMRVKEPRRVGVDRWLNAIAARALYGAPCLALDFGTATKFDVVGPDGAFWGGAIAPGLTTAAESLTRNTAQLPRIDFTAPPSPIGDDTTSAMQSGIVLGYVGLIEGLLSRIRASVPGNHPLPAVATGGLAPLILPLTQAIAHHEPTLTLQGLRIVYERNVRKKP